MGMGLESLAGEIKNKVDDLKSRMPSFFDELTDLNSEDEEKSKNIEVSTISEENKNYDKEKIDDSKKEKTDGQIIHPGDEVSEEDNPEDKTEKFLDKLSEILSSNEKVRELIEQNPELKVKLEKCLDIINNPDKHSPVEINWALDRIKKEIKGAIFEAAVKEALSSIGLDVEESQRTVEGETGATRPDVIGTNNTDKPIILFGKTINPGESLYAECKCGRKEYMEGQLKNHLPNQLSGHDGISILITTEDMDSVDTDLLEDVIGKNDTTVVIMDSSAADIEGIIKEAV